MKSHWIKAFLMSAVILGGPGWLVGGVLEDWRFWLLFLLSAVLIGTQPDVRYANLGRDQITSEDRSTLIVLQLAAYAVLVISYGSYLWKRHTAGPAPCVDWVSVLGALVAVGGMGLRVVAIRTLGKWFTAAVTLQEGQQLIRHGVYRRIRHPSYTGAILFWGALPFLLNVPVCALAAWPVLLLAYSRRIGAEEIALASKFREEFEEYRKQSWKLFPPIF